MARSWSWTGPASRASRRCSKPSSSRRGAPSSTWPSTCCSSTGATCGRCRWWSARRGWPGCSKGAAAPPLLRAFDVPGQRVYDRACRRGLEGIIAKQKNAPYRSGRGQAWLKVKCVARQELVIGGYTDPDGARAEFGSLLLGVHDREGRLVYAGRVGTGFDRATLKNLGARLRKLERRASPFSLDGPRPPARGAHWVKPELVAEVAFTEWTRDGLLRHPAFQGLREDKPAAQIVRETSRAPKPARAHPIAGGSDGPVAVAGVTLTHPDRVLYREQAITKVGLARYYEAVADWMVPHVADRPLSLVRCPEGERGACFYQKHAAPGVPKQVKRVRIRESGGGTASYLYLNDLPGVIALAQIGVLELHPWGTRVGRLERPDRLVIDLDPAPGLPWARVVEAAEEARALLKDLGLVSFVKTTGGKGLHVVVPLRPEAGWDALRALGEGIGAEMTRRAPDRYTINPSTAAPATVSQRYLRTCGRDLVAPNRPAKGVRGLHAARLVRALAKRSRVLPVETVPSGSPRSQDRGPISFRRPAITARTAARRHGGRRPRDDGRTRRRSA